MTPTKSDAAVAPSVPDGDGRQAALRELKEFRVDLRACLTRWGDALFEITDAVLCSEGPVRNLAELTLVPEHARSHGSVQRAMNNGRIDVDRLHWSFALRDLPRGPGGGIVLAVDVSPWLRPDANTSNQRTFCHTYGRAEGTHEMIPGWAYSIIAALSSGPTSWTAPLDARRLRPGDQVQQCTAHQLREVVTRLVALGRWREGDEPIRIVADCGYDGPYLAHQLADLPVEVCVRMRGDRVLYRDPPANGGVGPKGGRPQRHGSRFEFHAPDTWGDPLHETEHDLDKYGHMRVRCFERLHVKLNRQTVWARHPEPELPLVPGTVIRLDVERLPSGGSPKPLWLWWSRTDTDATLADTIWSCFLRRFDLEHTFRYWKQHLGWTRPRLREAAAADRWTVLVMAVYTQLRLARPLAEDLKRPWERPLPVERMTPGRVRRGFRQVRRSLPVLTKPTKPSRPGPGRPPGRRNKRKTPVYDVGNALLEGSQRTEERRTEHPAP
ncbi:NF041680 family putative transposase [Streptomyces sp. NPDC051020]|uniref:NF041680 family putative transposase n=1 Tax=Streptomyces sp. NPDC051020 TaxID=3155409 RepID=UPI003434C38F